MKEKFEKFIEDLKEKINDDNYKINIVADFCCEITKGSEFYTIKYDSSCIFLEKSEKKICEWLFKDDLSKGDIDCIINDFCNTIKGKTGKISLDKSSDKKNKNESLVKFDEMLEKILQFMPDVKENFYTKLPENSKLSDKIVFLKDEVVPQLNKMISRTRDDKKLERLFSNLCKDYAFGDEDTRCVITMIIFNGIEDEKSRIKVRSILPTYMQKTWAASWRVK